mmetsp:Transcript_21550/g.35563  ORF Transcript_21550/g.35563 Transcript_21550/m.35563 type:complete len:505 (-) Transcript_21550:335-1849(-)|eukprot:CAMPEP_0119329238 /NCGR_PEP_ID=MMETSP1333-20130426/75395_1 /TAXON_ID=418940 /ORGANISM="Scyphosphaera apsteinii, Strain RCC1455" /LENGTH=504 /DNA_ID=CAMNT_0007338307 /DNA_START=184 /DNA_END=1698 /DNA_ORIENTATION=+
MVFYFTCSDPQYSIFMGRDKYENEELIKYGWPEDLWFHVDKMSSAHVYLRLPPGQTIRDVPESIVHECAQLTKLNSIEGCKVNNVKVVYTMWSNLCKRGDMAVGQVSFHDRSQVQSVVIEKRINEIVNRLNKTKEERNNHPTDLANERAARDAAELEQRREVQRHEFKQQDLDRENARQQKQAEVERLQATYGEEVVSETVRAAIETDEVQKRFDSMHGHREITISGGGFLDSSDEDDDIFGSALYTTTKSKIKGKGAHTATDEGDDEPSTSASDCVGGLALSEMSVEQLERRAALVYDKKDQMEVLTVLAYARKAEAERKHALDQQKKSEALQAQKQQQEDMAAALLSKRSMMESQLQAFEAQAATSLEEMRVRGKLETVLEENLTLQDEETMVLQAIFGEDCTLGGSAGDTTLPERSLRLVVQGEDGAQQHRRIVLFIRMVSQYPSHLPPHCELLDGVAQADAVFVIASLRLLFFERADGASIIHQWSEWLRDEWIAVHHDE